MNNRKVLGCLIIVATFTLLAVLVSTAVAQNPVLTPREQLGKLIFFDDNLSVNGNQSCATCHGPEAGWTGPESETNAHGAVYEGSIPGAFGDRKPPSAAYATQSPIFSVDRKGLFVGGNFWDGRATGEILGSPAAEQAKGPFLNPVEQALPSADVLVAKVCAASYGDLFRTYGAAVPVTRRMSLWLTTTSATPLPPTKRHSRSTLSHPNSTRPRRQQAQQGRAARLCLVPRPGEMCQVPHRQRPAAALHRLHLR